MKVFVFEQLGQVSGSYHSEGGLIVVAANTEQAKRLIAEDPFIEITPDEWAEVVEYELLRTTEPRVFVFPDAGCC